LEVEDGVGLNGCDRIRLERGLGFGWRFLERAFIHDGMDDMI